MRLITLHFFLFLGWLSYGQTCSSLSTPSHGEIDVPVDTPIRWSTIPNIIGYVVSLGTSPGGGEIINRRSSGQNNFYIPEVGLPSDTQIYVTISYFKAGQPFTTCEIETFRTAEVTRPPGCTSLENPLNNTANIEAETELTWAYSSTATGYLLSIGTTPGGTDIYDNLDVGNLLSYEPLDGLPADREVFVTIIPYNDIGPASPCMEESFVTTSAVVDCGPYFDYVSGSTITLGPQIEFPERIGFCDTTISTVLTANDQADGYRWYSIDSDGNETLLSSTNSVELSNIGRYRYEAYNNIVQSATTVECANSKIFSLIASELPIVHSIEDVKTRGERRVTVNTHGSGHYEYALNNREGPYQDEPVFNGLSDDYHSIFVRDKNGCGITEASVQRNLSQNDFPKFFTPNGDNVNDYWQFIEPRIENEIVLTTIHIFNRYGNLLAVLDPKSKGWDGKFRGEPLPSADYWFRAFASNKQEVRGHFSLKR